MNSRSPRYELITYLLAFLLALGLRFARLGELPLTDSEARLALDALQITQGGNPALSSHVAYANLTAILFFIFGSFNFLARFWPAVAGSALVFAPLLFREQIRSRPAAILAIFFAMDPASVALSRQAGSPILAVAAFLFAAGFWLRRQPRAAGVFLALALLSGPTLWMGVLSILLAWLLMQFLSARQSDVRTDSSETTEYEPKTDTRAPASVFSIKQYTPLLISTILTLLGFSTLFLLAPQGLGAWLASLPEFIRGWVGTIAVPVSRLFLALGMYQLLGIPFAVAAILRGWLTGDEQPIRLSLWMLVALLLAVFYPAHQTADLVWMLIPLWTLAALELARHLEIDRTDGLEAVGVMIFTVLLLAFAWLDLSALSLTPIPSEQGTIRMLLFFGALLLLILSVVLVGFGWSESIARVGVVCGAIIILGFYTLGAAWGATGLRNPNAVEPWNSSPGIAQADLLSQTADETSEWAMGQTDALAVTIYGVDSPALLWSLRNHHIIVAQALAPASSPELVITPPQDSLGLAAAYRGQDFVWRQTPIWDSIPSYFLRFFLYHELPTSSETLVLWVRSDLFIDSESSQP
jgi:hypothetical protein